MILYVITNRANGKQYVGMTAMSLARRLQKHREAASKSPRTALHRAMARDGFDSFVAHEIGRARDRAELQEMERAAIIARRTLAPHGYNMTAGGDGQVPGYTPDDHARAKVATAARRTWANMTPEQRAERGRRISEAKRGKAPARPDGWVTPLRGSTRSPEFKAAVSEGMKRHAATLPPGEMRRRFKRSTGD